MRGVVDSRVGYTGGTTPDPTYESVCAKSNTHTEALRLEIDPAVLSYEELMRHFADDPHVRNPSVPGRPQYMTAVWAQDSGQAEVAERMLADAGKERVPVFCDGSAWHDAEEYHQHFLGEFKDFPEDDDDEANPWSTVDGPGTWMGL